MNGATSQVIERTPVARLVGRVATPVASRVATPRDVAPSLKVTFPVGMPAPGAAALTVAVKKTDCPNTLGFTDDATATFVLA